MIFEKAVFDIPNFVEMDYWKQHSYLNSKYPGVFAAFGDNATFDSFSKDIINCFNKSKNHWASLTDTDWQKWDAIYIYISPNNRVATVRPARYNKK